MKNKVLPEYEVWINTEINGVEGYGERFFITAKSKREAIKRAKKELLDSIIFTDVTVDKLPSGDK